MWLSLLGGEVAGNAGGTAGLVLCSQSAHNQNVLVREGARHSGKAPVLAGAGSVGETMPGVGGSNMGAIEPNPTPSHACNLQIGEERGDAGAAVGDAGEAGL